MMESLEYHDFVGKEIAIRPMPSYFRNCKTSCEGPDHCRDERPPGAILLFLVPTTHRSHPDGWLSRTGVSFRAICPWVNERPTCPSVSRRRASPKP